ncbi:MerR family transcriptional regulator [Glutamicibacter endophyticus]|nr:MerR family transcriptional regulator [Glutamicibacter sp. PS]
MHPQTLRQYDRLGLVSPSRQAGKQRRYSLRDVALLRQVQALSKDGVSLEGIRRILNLEAEVERLRAQVDYLGRELQELRESQSRIFAAGTTAGDVVSMARGARPGRREPTVTFFAARRAIGR